MLCRSFAFAGLLLFSGCAYDAGYVESNYAHDPASAAGYYSAIDYSPYQQGSPVYGSPYVEGPVLGGIYSDGDERDEYGGPIFSPYHGIRCDRRRNLCWSRSGPNYGWSYRFFGRRHAYWKNNDWHDGNWNDGDWNDGGWNGGGHHHGGGNNGGGHGPGDHGGGNHGPGNHGGPNPNGPNPNGPNPNGPNPGGYVYQVPTEPDGSGAPTFYPNACGGNGQPPC